MKNSSQSKFYTAAVFLITVIYFFIPRAVVEGSQPTRYQEAVARFEDFVKERMAFDRAVGLCVGFLKDDFTWASGFGYADLENRVPAKPESSYRLASITKTFTAAAVLHLEEQGKIDLDAEVQAYVPFFPRKKWPVTVRLLLGHLAGISHYKDYDEEGHIKVHKNTREALDIFKDFDLVAEPGSQYHYSSYGFNLLGAVIEGASGQSYGDYIKENIFAPLGMENSCLDDPVTLIPNRVRGYRLMDNQVKNSEYVDISSRFAGGGTRSTVVDMLKYARGILAGKVLKEESSRKMFTSMVTRKGQLTDYGMGWGVRPWRGHFQLSHGGSQHETRTYILILPKEKFAAAFASNLEDLDLMPYVRRLTELVLQEDIDCAVYAASREMQALISACDRTFSYGLSFYKWNEIPLTHSEQELKEAFAFFNRYVELKVLKENYHEVKKMIDSGIQPVFGQPFTKIGSFMAACLEEAYGEEKLREYQDRGPLAFFGDFIKIGQGWSKDKRGLTFSKGFRKMLYRWQQDWDKTYNDYTQNLVITPGSDFQKVGQDLKKIFGKSQVFPDLSRDMLDIALIHLVNDRFDKAFEILTPCSGLYPNSPEVLSYLAFANLWIGRHYTARNLFQEAFKIDPDHPGVSLNRFSWFCQILQERKKLNPLFELAAIALEIYPKSAQLHKQVGDIYLKTGREEKALEFYQKALKLKPDFPEAKEGLEKIGKRGKTIHR